VTSRLDNAAQDLLRDLAPQVLGILLRRYRDFAGCEDAVQEALIAGAMQWPEQGIPDNPRGWLLTVATRRLTDQIRADAARRLRERLVVSLIPLDEQIAMAADADGGDEREDTLDLYFLCCHPALSIASQVALTLRAIGGLTTAEIARAYLVPEATMTQRLTRAKATIQSAGGSFPELTTEERAARLRAVLKVLYLVFSEGYTASGGKDLYRVDLSSEAIRVTRLLAQLLPGEPEVGGLLALMLLTDARREARTGANGELIPLDEQDRSQWDRSRIEEGTGVLEGALSRGAPGSYQIQAAIAALHDEAASTEATDWTQIRALYELLLRLHDSPMARLSWAVALAMVEGPRAGLAALDDLDRDPRLASHHRLDAARAHLLERAGDHAEAIRFYRQAARRTTSTPERDYLLLHAARLSETLADEERGDSSS
jgi:RNA polymerase sigma factor (sigma-70 family)